MDSSILAELETIRWVLVAILICIGLITLFFAMSFVHTWRYRRNELEEGLRNQFVSEAHRHEDSGDYEALYQLAWTRNSNYPHDPTALWFLGISHYRRKKWGQALSAFKQLQALDPAWQKHTVEEYITETQEHLTGPSGATSN